MRINELLIKFNEYLGMNVEVRGRVLEKRSMKKYTFVDLFHQGAEIQLIFENDQYPDICTKPGDLVFVTGNCEYTNSKEPSINVSSYCIKAKYRGKTEFKDLSGYEKKNKNALLLAQIEKYNELNLSFLIRNISADLFKQYGFVQTHTPVINPYFNGGRSYPVESQYSGNHIGYNRTTMEEKMQAIIGAGFEKIFQIGEVFRSDQERTFLEAYSILSGMDNFDNFVKGFFSDLLTELSEVHSKKLNETGKLVVGKVWLQLRFHEETEKIYGSDWALKIMKGNKDLLKDLNSSEIVTSKKIPSLEAAADKIAQKIADKYSKPVLISGFPVWSSPLYKIDSSRDSIDYLHRSRGFFPNQKGGFEYGIQENDLSLFEDRLELQRDRWGIESPDPRVVDSTMQEVLSAGVPSMVGFAVDLDRICGLLVGSCAKDPFG